MPDAIGAKAAYGAAQNARLGGTGSVITSRPAPISSGGGGGGGSSPAPPPARPWYENYDLATLARMVKADPSRVLPTNVIDQFPNEVFLDNPALIGKASSVRQQTLFRDRPELDPAAPPRIVMPPPPVPVPPARETMPTTPRPAAPPPAAVLPVPPPPAVPAPAAPPATKGPYDAFNEAFKGAFGRDITQDQLNDNAFLQTLGNDLFRLLPVDRQVGFSSARIAELSNQDAWPVLKKLAEINPQGFVTAFPTSFWRRFDNDKIAKDFLPLFSQHNPTEAANIIRQNGIGGANAGALPPEQRPGAPGGLPGAPSTGVPAAPSPVPGTPPPASTPPPAYTGPGEFAIPRAAPPVLSADILSRSALDQFYQNLGSGDFGRTPPPVTGAPPAASPVGARLSGAAPPNVAPRPFPGRPPYDEPPEGVEVEVGEDGQTYWRDPDTGRAFNPATQMIENEDGTWDYIGDPDGGQPPKPTPSGDGWTYLTDRVREKVLPDGRTVRETLSQTYTDGSQKWDTTIINAPKPAVGRAPARPAQPSQAALIGPDLLRDEVQSQIDLRDAQIADLIAKRDQAKAEMDTAGANRQEANQIAWANLAREIEANLAATQLARDTLIQRQAEFGVEASGMIGDQPTFQREQVINQAELNNKKFQLEAATSAAQVALKDGDQREARRQFDIAQGLKAEIERGQLGLSTEIQRGQLGLATRSQEEAERQGGFGRELEAAKFQFQVQRDPASFAQRAYAMRGQPAPPAVTGPAAPPTVSFAPVQPPAPQPIRSGPAPGTTPRYPMWQPIGGAVPPVRDETEYIGRPAVTAPPARLHSTPPPARNQYATPAQQSFATTLNPLTAAEIKANVGPGLANTLEGRAPGQFFSEVPRLSAQRFNQLLPSERKEYGAAALASGTDPDDLMEEIRRRSQTGTPPPAVTTRTRRAPKAVLY